MALVIVLAFVVLLTGLILAFFSRAISERQISNSSASLAKVEIFAQGSVDTIIGDLQQEIAAGSTITSPAAGVSVYTPTVAQTAVPAIVAPTARTFDPTTGLENDGLANLVKGSFYQQPFYAGTNYSANFPPSNRAAQSPTTVPSQNGRSVSLARWNKALLVARNNSAATNDTDFTPAAAFTAPDWILVGRDNSNPTVWSDDLKNPAKANYPIGRYAYTIYDEGGVLDANAAGYPSGAYPSDVYTRTGSMNSLPVQPTHKGTLAYADLTIPVPQNPLLPSGGTQPLLTPAQVNALAGWRNFASGKTSGSFPNYTPAATPTPPASPLSPFDFFVLGNRTGFLTTGRTPLTIDKQSDRMFGSRQEMIRFLLQGVAASGPAGQADRASLENALQYLGNFSRGINQPSYAPDTRKIAAAPTATAANGGNNIGTGDGVPDGVINPSFLSVRVLSGGWSRNDGSVALVNEPLVKKRFDLSRLAWLTCNGPIADDSGNLSGDPTIQSVITALETSYGYTDAFLKQGGPTNIYKYFGLIWQSDSRPGTGDGLRKWVYNHASSTLPGTLSLSIGGNPIKTLTALAQTREPDFFELLKASISLGSLGKAYMYYGSPDNTTPQGYQQTLDNSVDLQVIQIGANIVNQAAVDTYTRRVLFSDNSILGGKWHEVRGVVDLPYLYRLREGKIMTAESAPTSHQLPVVTPAGASSPLTSQGLGVVIQEPEIWNPHAYRTTPPNINLRPSNFRLIAISTDPESDPSTAGKVQPNVHWNFQTDQSGSGSTPDDPNPATASGAPINTLVSGGLSFMIPTGRLDLFREPTLLLKPNVPAGSSLSGPAITSILQATQYIGVGAPDDRQYTGVVMGTVHMAWTGTIPQGGISNSGSPSPTTTTANCAIPAGWVTYTAPGNSAKGITYRLQYQDPSGSWVTYDEKFANIANAGSYDSPVHAYSSVTGDYNKTFSANVDSNVNTCDHIIGSEMSVVGFDPRSSRFGMVFAGTNGRGTDSYCLPLGRYFGTYYSGPPNPPPSAFLNGWAVPPAGSGSLALAATQNAVQTTRPDEYIGFPFSGGFNDSPPPYGGPCGYNCGPTLNAAGPPGNFSTTTLGGWYPINHLAITNGAYGTPAVVLPGEFCQNNPIVGSATTTKRFNGDLNLLPTSGTFTSSVSFANPHSGPYDYNQQYFADPDGVVRRAMAANVPVVSSNQPATTAPVSGKPSGLPLKPAMTYDTGTPQQNTGTNEYASRPIMLNRPFQSVADLGYVFTGTPWRNLDMTTPESGAVALLDVFTTSDSDDPRGVVAGKVNLNTRQLPILQAILTGTCEDELNPAGSTLGPVMAPTLAALIAKSLEARTQVSNSTQGPLVNLSELVGGKWNSSVAAGTSIDGGSSFVGFSADTVHGNDLASIFTSAAFPDEQRIARFREAPVRALASCGQTRVWNLMIDVVAQTGRYPTSATATNPLTAFLVEGERRYWIHVAIDRYTGEVLDKQIEVVKE